MENLRAHQRQLDADGVEVGVSRQALEEVLGLVEAGGALSAAMRDVTDFHDAFDVPYPLAPTMQDAFHAGRRSAWIKEEADELLEATDLAGQADAYIDAIYFAVGGLVELGIDPSPLWAIVHGANMAKRLPDGTVERHPETGKIIKPAGWVAPEPLLRAEVQRQIAVSPNGQHALAALRASDARVRELEQPTAWRPIETAPKDGTRILLGSWAVHKIGEGTAFYQTVGYWCAEFEAIYSDETDGADYRGAWTDDTVASWGYEENTELSPTHWLPLPSAPVSAARDHVGGEFNRIEDEARPFHEMLNELRRDEGDSVTLLSDNPEGPPNNAIECNGMWTNWEDRRFDGQTLHAAVRAAYVAKTAPSRLDDGGER
jgi:predicted HAD superfamily Cof-like phosphohydrolase